ncbi:hsp20-like protein [Neurospora intermedia]|uniref:Hsp20-like protein n=1 Tax=Neurospora intermedia TaxID=5142 RepID=A0ABR3D6V5_NEUIN
MVFTFPSDFATSDPNFTTLFRLLDDFDTYSREVSGGQEPPRPPRIQHGGGGGGRWGRKSRGFSPRFDIRETKDAYELYGEVPGADRDDIHIELTEPNTLLIYGRIEREYDPTPEEEGGAKESKGKEDKGKEKQKAEGEGSAETEAEKKAGGKKGAKKDDTFVRFFLRERHVGEFGREFAFPGPLEELDIDATLEKGIIKVVAPKHQPQKGRKIEVK